MTDRYYHLCRALILTVGLFCSLPGNVRGETVDRILATIDDQVITLADYKLFSGAWVTD
jgi:hypothetical protein